MILNKFRNYFHLKRFSLIILISFIIISLIAPLIANNKPIYIKINGQTFYPAINNSAYFSFMNEKGNSVTTLSSNTDWGKLNSELIIFSPVAWSPGASDLMNVYSSPFSKQFFINNQGITETLPFRFRHFLGTGKRGNDLLSELIYGARTAVITGVFSVAIALLIGILLGLTAGYFGNYKLKASAGGIIMSILLIIPAIFYSFLIRRELIHEAFNISFISGLFHIITSIILFIMLSFWPLFFRFKKIPLLGSQLFIPVDAIISRFIELFLSFPRLILIITIAAITTPSYALLIFIIGITSWTEIARIIRAKVLQLRELNYISSAQSTGMTSLRILFTHLLPNAFSQIPVIAAFGVASAILIETGLSFLGIGLPVSQSTWGTIIYSGRENFQAWWLIIFPGLSIFLLLSSLYNSVSRKEKRIYGTNIS